jgi:hypothetical protein
LDDEKTGSSVKRFYGQRKEIHHFFIMYLTDFILSSFAMMNFVEQTRKARTGDDCVEGGQPRLPSPISSKAFFYINSD